MLSSILRSALIPLYYFALAFALLGCATQQLKVPSLAGGDETVEIEGKFVWYDLFTEDIEMAADFYRQLFGWTLSDAAGGSGQVKDIYLGGVPIGNMLAMENKHPDSTESRWLSYVSVNDLQNAITAAQNNGAQIHLPERDLPERGRIAIIIDPAGAILGLVESPQGVAPDDTGFTTNGWLSSELWTSSVADAETFYAALLGFEIETTTNVAGGQYRFWVRNERRRAGLVEIKWEGVEPDWLAYVAVEDAAGTAARAKELGGRILLEPNEQARAGRVGIIADPTGAVFAVQELPISTTTGAER